MSVASGYVHISLRNANKAPAVRPEFANRPAAAPQQYPAGYNGQFAAPAPAQQPGYPQQGYGQLRAVPQPGTPAAEGHPLTAPTPVIARGANGAPARAAAGTPTVARGFVLYVGIDEETAAASGQSIAKLAQEIRAYAQSLVQGAESYAAVAVAPASAPGSALDVVRSTFGDPTVANRQRVEAPRPAAVPDQRPSGVLIDLARREVHLDGDTLNLTFKEFELLNYLVENGTRTVDREELLENLWRNAEEVPNERTIDVHIRRLRSKLGRLANTVRTVRGQGYRFYEHPEVVVWAAPEYSI
ncbi:winged helix-turn-helix domain-containing protein [Arthrobacter sp. Y-9]|uniref:winged helix-turn-helix domain-containing protein n=1 Tax=Arthrobacter sp. Y-9 TaxID=3039385 RepID=UPI00241C9CDA|nr:winged helix-turn-helix domain-containing protein [Arthrobacter sp. Y-9]WFR84579.1 winged helix-turn-helix domain-containing protein [Arthrobacter sp. Y-9]